MQVLALLRLKAGKQRVADLVVDERQAGPICARPDEVAAARLRHRFHDAPEILTGQRSGMVQIEGPAENRSGGEQPLCSRREAFDPASQDERGAPRGVYV